MLGYKMDFSSCAIWTSFHKSSHILIRAELSVRPVRLLPDHFSEAIPQSKNFVKLIVFVTVAN